MTGAVRHPDDAALPVVAFDFDGTLTCADSFIAFLAWRAGPAAFAAGLTTLIPAAAAYALNRDRGALKAATARRFLGGASRAELAADARRFSEARSRTLLRPDAVACWRDWRDRGARLWIVTASPEIVVAPFAQALGADGLIGTRLAFDSRDRFTGRLASPNCRGAEKVTRLREALGSDLHPRAAYGDTAGDREMLAFAQEAGFKVFRGRP